MQTEMKYSKGKILILSEPVCVCLRMHSTEREREKREVELVELSKQNMIWQTFNGTSVANEWATERHREAEKDKRMKKFC